MLFSPDLRRPVEVTAEHEDQLVAWLSKRMGSPMKPPRLQALGCMLDGGRLLPGGQGPVAQFMDADTAGAKLTLYISNELPAGASARPAANPSGARPAAGQPAAPAAAGRPASAFRFARKGAINVFYGVDGPFGYALSSGNSRDELARVSGEVYRQLSQCGQIFQRCRCNQRN